MFIKECPRLIQIAGRVAREVGRAEPNETAGQENSPHLAEQRDAGRRQDVLNEVRCIRWI
jgi:hypothetical protein